MKRLLLAPLLIYISLLNMGFMGKPKLEALYCDQEKYMKASIEEMWENFPWIYDNKDGKLYKYDSFLNEINFMETDKVGESLYTFESRLDGKILKIKETETSYGYVLDDRRYIIDTKEKKSTHYPVDNPERKYINRCIKLELPKGVKINY